jgi:hypothetical protein
MALHPRRQQLFYRSENLADSLRMRSLCLAALMLLAIPKGRNEHVNIIKQRPENSLLSLIQSLIP